MRLHPALAALPRLRQRMIDSRAEAEQAERAYQDAVLTAHQLTGDAGHRVFTVQQIADAAGTSRGPIYKRITRAAS
jgi:hypothetical protein